MIRILLVDDQKSIRERLKSLLETEPDFDIVGMVDNGYDAIEQVRLLRPDVVLMDMEMPDINGILATKIIAHSSVDTKILVLSSYDTDEYVAQSIHSGANGYILKGAPAQEIRDAVRFVNRGYMQIAPGLFEKFIPSPQALRSTDRLPLDGAFKSVPDRLNFPPGLELTGLNIVRAQTVTPTVASPPDFDQPSELVLDITAQTSRKSVGWYQATALALSGLGLTSGLYFLRQGLNQPVAISGNRSPAQQFHNLPFTGKILPFKSIEVNAALPGVISDLNVKIGQSVHAGDRLLTIHNTDGERANQEKIRQQRQLAAQQQLVARRQATQQQQQTIQQQQILAGEQQAAAERVNTLQFAIANYQRNLAPLRQQVADANVQVTVSTDRPEQSLLRQKRTAIDRAQAIYDRNLATYERLAQYHKQGAISRERLDQAEKEMTVTQSDLKIVQEDYDSAISTEQMTASKRVAQIQASRLQQQLVLKEQAGQLQQLRTQLKVAQADYQQLSTRLQQLPKSQLSPIPIDTPTDLKSTLEPTTINIFAPIEGMTVELPISANNRVLVGSKLLAIANPRKLKISVDLDSQQATHLKAGQRAIVKVGQSIDSQQFVGVITNIEPPIEKSTQHVEVEFTNPKQTILIGQMGTVYFPIAD